MQLLRSLLLLIVPGSLFCAALYLHLKVTVPTVWLPLLGLFPYLAVAAGLFLGWRFNRTRVLWAIAVLILAERALVLTTPFAREYVLQVAPVLVPLNLALYSCWSERGLFTLHGLMRLVILLLQLGGATWLYFAAAGEVIAWLGRPLIASPFLDQSPLSQISLLVVLLSFIVLLVRFFKKIEALEASFCWVLGAVVAGFWWPQHFSF